MLLLTTDRDLIGMVRRHGHAPAPTPVQVTLLFCDVVRFTEMTERLGDFEAHRVIGEFRRLVGEELKRHRGDLVEVRGDGFLFAFRCPSGALACAVAIQQALARLRSPQLPVRVRMGMHTGPSLRDADRYFGKSVIVAARITSVAEPGAILVSSQVIDALPEGHDLAIASARIVRLKGLRRRYRLLAVDWVAARAVDGDAARADPAPGPAGRRRGTRVASLVALARLRL